MRKLAEKCNISQSYISDLENEKIKKPSIDTIYKIADALEVSVFDLVGEQYKNATEDFSEDGVFFTGKSDENDKINEVVQFMLLSEKIVNSKVLDSINSKVFTKLCNEIIGNWTSNLSESSARKISEIYNIYKTK